MTRINWSEKEVEIIVKDYFQMLQKELRDEDYSKSSHRKGISHLLNVRSKGSIEFKHQNISSILIELGIPYISGYKPRSNYQALLKEGVEDFLNSNPEYFNLFDEYVKQEMIIPEVEDLLARYEEKPKFKFKVQDVSNSYTGAQNIPNYYEIESHNKKIGLLGEKFVIQYEKARLTYDGLENLADQIVHISEVEGDHAGYDILSFDSQGKDRYIEVKTTKFGKDSPFYLTRNELKFSEKNTNQYFLYRVFKFRSDPRLYWLEGTLSNSCILEPNQYIGRPR